MPLKVIVAPKDQETYIISPEGSIDSGTHTILGSEVDAVLKTSAKFVIFDMKDVNFVSSAGVSVVLMAEKSLKARGGHALMVNAQPQIKKVFAIVHALPNQQIFTSVQEMDAYLKEIQRKVVEGEME